MTSRRGRSKPWFTREVRRALEKRNRVYTAYRKNPTPQKKQQLQHASNAAKSAISHAKDVFYASFHSRLKTNPREFWQFIKRNRKDEVSIPVLEHNGSLVHESLDKAECFSSFFSSVFSARATNTDPMFHYGLIGGEPMNDIVFDRRGIQLQLERLSTTSASGPDDLPNFLLSACAGPLSKYLCVLFTKSLTCGLLPADWKIANVVPIPKSGPRKFVFNYRPVSLTSVLCKIFEHVLFSNIMSHLNRFSLLIPQQHGFRSGYSCVTQLTELTHDLASTLDKGGCANCIFLDLRKAFDVVPHSLLLEKLSWYNINKTVVEWIKEYLSCRTQRVVVGGERSHGVDVSSGVPQGSVLGPLLFLLYMNDISKGISSCIRLFADDCVLYRVVKGPDDYNELQKDLDKVAEWCDKWGMGINLDKTVQMCFTRQRSPHVHTYSINGTNLASVCEYKYLGVYLTQQLCWHRHVDYIIAKACRVLGMLRRNAKCFPLETRNLLYKTNIRPILEYACTIWDPWTVTDITKLERVQTLAARFVVQNYTRYFSASQTKENLGWNTLQNRRKTFRLKFLHSIYHNRSGLNRDSYIKAPEYTSARRDHPLKIKEYRCRTELFKMSFFPKTVSEWNRLPSDVVSLSSSDAFASAV